MNGIVQDLIGNLVMVAGLYISARRTPRRKGFWLRFLAGFILFSVLRHLAFSLAGNIPWEDREYPVMAIYTAFIPVLAAMALVCWEMDFWAALCCGSSAYCLQHIMNTSYDIVRHLWLSETGIPAAYLSFMILSLTTVSVYWLIVRKQQERRIRIDSKALLLLSLMIVISAIVLNAKSYEAIQGARAEAFYIVRWYSLIAVVMNLGFQLTLVSTKNKELEINTLHALLEEQQEQYRFEKSIIDTLNIKVHDIRHQLQDIDEEKRQELIQELDPVLESYSSKFNTENSALDVILRRKSFVCHEQHIHLTVMADGKALNFMKEEDIYSLFGNILDNTIEAVGKLEEKEQKVIKLSVEKQGFFVNIHAENYFSEKLDFEDGLPRTTKPDTVYHGFGLKSIRMLVEQYEGNVKIVTEGNRFILDILFPV